MEIIIAVLGGSALAALINQVGEYVRQRKKHSDDTTTAENKDMTAVKTALKFIMLDRIMWLGQAYIKAGEVSFDNRRRLNEMHESYHSGLGGNGDLDTLMEEVNDLPLKAV